MVSGLLLLQFYCNFWCQKLRKTIRKAFSRGGGPRGGIGRVTFLSCEKARDPMPLTLRLPPLQTQCGGFGKTHSVLWREFIVIPEKIAAAIHICGITPRVFNGNYIRGRAFRGRSAVFFGEK